ncbi:MAG: sugar ABC transporter ATP-binding protein [Filifactoraceae bacterium]
MGNYILSMDNITKDYFGNKVLKGVSLNVKPGEIHALLGENGAGKSTLMNILFGMPVIHSTGGFDGNVILDGEKVSLKSPKEAMEKGIGMVHQEFMLIPGFTVAENIKLNREVLKGNPISTVFGKNLKTLDIKKMESDARVSLDTLGMNIDEKAYVSGLPVGYMQFIEIAREIDKSNVKLLVFDEPTAVLTETEADMLLEAMKKIAASGIAILFITHRLDEVMSVCDNITILRDGELICTMAKHETTIIELAEKMVGRKIEAIEKKNKIEEHEIIMSIKNLKVHMPSEEAKGINLDIRKGEILGIGGLAGQGKLSVANGVIGLYPTSGEVIYKGNTLPIGKTKDILAQNIAFVSEDRKGVGLLLDTSIEDNIVITAMEIQNKYLKKIGLKMRDGKKIRKNAVEMIKQLDIRCTGPTQHTRRLSGGNQQKVCIARALALKPDILFVSEPTRGIDIGAKKIVLDTLLKLSEDNGITVVITSSELAELRSVCDRIAIVTEGKVEGILLPTDSDADFGLMMSGDYKKIKEGDING